MQQARGLIGNVTENGSQVNVDLESPTTQPTKSSIQAPVPLSQRIDTATPPHSVNVASHLCVPALYTIGKDAGKHEQLPVLTHVTVNVVGMPPGQQVVTIVPPHGQSSQLTGLLPSTTMFPSVLQKLMGTPLHRTNGNCQRNRGQEAAALQR